MMMRDRQAGFSLIELMVAVAILALVTTQLLGMFSTQLQTYVTQKRVVEVQEDARLISDMMLLDTRMAGFMVPQIAGITSRDGGNAGPDAFCVSDPSIFSEASLAAAMGRFDDASLANPVAAGATTVDLVAGDMDVDGDGTVDFTVNRGLILSDGVQTHCARITVVAGATLTFTPQAPAGFAIAAPSARAVPAVVYELVGPLLNRNNLLLSPQVEDLQIEFGVDNNGDGQLGVGEFPIHSLAGSDPTAIRTIRVSVITRTASQDPQLTTPGRQALANRAAAGAPDNFRRRLMTVMAAPRNLL